MKAYKIPLFLVFFATTPAFAGAPSCGSISSSSINGTYDAAESLAQVYYDYRVDMNYSCQILGQFENWSGASALAPDEKEQYDKLKASAINDMKIALVKLEKPLDDLRLIIASGSAKVVSNQGSSVNASSCPQKKAVAAATQLSVGESSVSTTTTGSQTSAPTVPGCETTLEGNEIHEQLEEEAATALEEGAQEEAKAQGVGGKVTLYINIVKKYGKKMSNMMKSPTQNTGPSFTPGYVKKNMTP